ncbi:MAG: MFS transporter [Actinobacteria bacterium]|nr:MFS transporter [Actinomycetota bacterium]
MAAADLPMSRSRRLGNAVRRTPLLAGLPAEVAVLSAVAFCVALGFGILAPALPVFARTFDVTALQASAVISVFALVRFITSPLAGALVDRLGERVVMSSGLFIVALSSAAAGFSQTYGQLLALRGVGGLGSSMFTVSAMALLLRVVDSDQRGRAAGAFQGGFLLGGVAGPAVGGLVVAWSIRAPFFVYAITLMGAAIVALAFMAKSRLREREQEVSHGQADKLEQLRVALKDRAYQAALGTNLVTGFVAFGLRSSAVPLFVTEGLDRGASMTGIGFLLAMAVQGVAAAFLGSAPAAVVGDVMAGRKGGIVVATFQMMSDVGAVAGPLVAGLLIDGFDFDWAFAAGAALSLVAVVLVFLMPETLHRSRAPKAATA